MFIDYSKLWNKLAAMESLQKICKALHCDVGDICVVNEVVEEGEK